MTHLETGGVPYFSLKLLITNGEEKGSK